MSEYSHTPRQKTLDPNQIVSEEWHLDVYEKRSELHRGDKVDIFQEGPQCEAAKKRYKHIQKEIEEGFLDRVYDEVSRPTYVSTLDSKQKKLIDNLVSGVTSEVGRGLIGISFLQVTIKVLEPTQSIRLHKAGNSDKTFSWKEGVSMRTLDSKYTAPFLRKKDLLKLNKDGSMMTRSFAENYPYSKMYKAEIRGPIVQWIELVEALETDSKDAKAMLMYFIHKLKSQSDTSKQYANTLLSHVKTLPPMDFKAIKKMITTFYSETDYPARAFEVTIHSFVQALSEMNLIEGELVPLSQMRSANKKHGNVGDVEISVESEITMSWDAKYDKTYLADELGELEDKLKTHPSVELAGFICNSEMNIDDTVRGKKNLIEVTYGVVVDLLTIDEWINERTKGLSNADLNDLGQKWILALAESFCQKRRAIAPIDEPCDRWIIDLDEHVKRHIKSD